MACLSNQGLGSRCPLIPTQWASSHARAGAFLDRTEDDATYLEGFPPYGPAASEIPPVFALSSHLYSPKVLFFFIFFTIKDRKTYKTLLLSCVANAMLERGVGRRRSRSASLPRLSLCEPGEACIRGLSVLAQLFSLRFKPLGQDGQKTGAIALSSLVRNRPTYLARRSRRQSSGYFCSRNTSARAAGDIAAYRSWSASDQSFSVGRL